MTEDIDTGRPAPVATFQARVASVGLITTVVVLVAACLTFMAQQWVVARTQSHGVHQSLANVTARTASAVMAERDRDEAQAALDALEASGGVVAARLLDAAGRPVAVYVRPKAQVASRDMETITAPVMSPAGVQVGRLELSAARPALTPLLPQFIALTFVLLFGGVGVALFLARGMAHRVIAPVQRLSEAMNDVAAGGSFDPVKVEAQDELFRSLTASFNHLLAKLSEREEELKSAMTELEAARDAADAANVLKTQFLANMSHEIRTPLNGVLAMAEVMGMGELAPLQRDRLDVIRQSGNLLLTVLNDVLDLSKIEAGKLALTLCDFDLEAAVGPARDSFAVIAEGKGLTFSFDVAPAAQGWWRGDPDRLRQVIGNLLSNAVKFTSQGEVRTLVDVNPRTGDLRLVVSDTGVGIPPEKIPTLFEKFTQADNSATRRFGGTGLGLAICRELTQMMGGFIEVASAEQRGSTFTVELPLERGEAALAPGAQAVVHEEGALRLLAAEDNPTNQQVLAAVMESLDIELDIVPDGQRAVEAWRNGAYDLILMDIQMPVMDGIAAARAIRAAEKAEGVRRTPIVALTANALTHQVEEYLAVGMDGHVAKPIEIAKLYEAISTAINDAATGASASHHAA